MPRFSSPSRFPLSFMSSATTRWWQPGRRFSPLMMSPNPPISCVYRFPHGPWNMATLSRVEGDSGKPYMCLPISSAKNISLPLDNIETSDKDARRNILKDIYNKHDAWGQIVKHNVPEEDGRGTTEYHKGKIVVSDNEESSDDGVYTINILSESKHRDGSIYRCMDKLWKKEYSIVDRNETRLKAMTLSDPTDCIIHDGTCIEHAPCCMLQIFSLELAKIPMDGGSVELYGYIAVRDELEPLLNYVVNFSRDEPIVVEQGSLINMAGPKRGIDMIDYALIEYDLRIKSGEQEKDDLQLIDGASIIGPADFTYPSRARLTGGCGAIDLTLSRLENAVEATVEVLISEVKSSFSLSLSCLTSGFNKEIRLYNGAIAKSCCLKRSVVAVVWDSLIDLRFKLGSLLSSSNLHCCCFKSKTHGHDTQEIKTDFALISVKVTWSTLPGQV